MKGKFIAIEGIDGTGKSTLARRVRNMLELELGSQDIIVTHEPSSILDATIRGLFKREEGPLNPEAMSVLFTADRLLHMDQVVLPALRVGTWVVSDRHKLSTLVYQTSMGADIEVLRNLSNVPSPSPDLTVVLDLDAEVALQRMRKRNPILDSYEKDLEKQKERRELYKQHARAFGPAVIIDASGDETEVAMKTVNSIVGMLGAQR